MTVAWSGALERAPDGRYVWQIADDTGLPIAGTAVVREEGGRRWFEMTGETGEWPRFPRDPARPAA